MNTELEQPASKCVGCQTQQVDNVKLDSLWTTPKICLIHVKHIPHTLLKMSTDHAILG